MQLAIDQPGLTRNLAPDTERRGKSTGHLNVVLFCGGRGSASLIRELMRWPQVHLSLAVNGYDDGLSTGELRGLVPDMLGPSDFRKNLSRLVHLHSTEQYALQRLLEYRFPADFSATDIGAFEAYLRAPEGSGWLPSPLDSLFRELDPSVRRAITGHLRRFLQHRHANAQQLNYPDCSLGNLVFAGAYLESNANFNTSLQNLAEVCGSWAQLINVTRGENRTLVALKADGQILWRESDVVGPQSAIPVADIFLLDRVPDASTRRQIEQLTLEEKRRRLSELDTEVWISPEADYALRHADLIVYGPGTQFSSLMPSYRTKGLAEAIHASSASTKVMVANLDQDHDIQSLTASDLIDKALDLMGDPEGQSGLITHVLLNNASETRPQGIRPGAATGPFYKGATVVRGNFESAAKPGTHSGYSVIRRAIDLYERSRQGEGAGSVEIYVDLRGRSRAIEPLVQEMLDLPLPDHFDRVQLRVNKMPALSVKLPAYASLASSEYNDHFSEVDALLNWLAHSDTDYLVTLTGDGEYRLADILIGCQILRAGVFGAVYGSRTQSRHQFGSALDSAYGDHPLLRFASWCGAFFFAAVFGMRMGMILSDPFTGFRIYARNKFAGRFTEQLIRCGSVPAATITRLMILNGIEIAEIPITYRTFRGFTNPVWRIGRGLRNLAGLFRK